MIPSVILNALIVLINLVCTVFALTKLKPKILFRYFTVLSNLLCCAASVAVLLAWAVCGELPLWIVLFKYVGTVAVSVTLVTVFAFLGPVSGEWKHLLSGADLFWHLICPLLAIVSYCAFEHRIRFGFAWVLLGMLPVLLYGTFYTVGVIFMPEDRRMEDFYGFNKNGKWYLSILMMLIGSFAICVALWAV